MKQLTSYESPAVEVVLLASQDIVTSSQDTPATIEEDNWSQHYY